MIEEENLISMNIHDVKWHPFAKLYYNFEVGCAICNYDPPPFIIQDENYHFHLFYGIYLKICDYHHKNAKELFSKQNDSNDHPEFDEYFKNNFLDLLA